MTAQLVRGRLVLDAQVAAGRIHIDDGVIQAVELDDREAGGALVTPGFVDIHVHGWGGHDAMGGLAGLDGMARGLLRHGVTTFLPTAVSAPLHALTDFADSVRRWMTALPGDGAEPVGFNLEGPFIAAARKGAHDLAHLRAPADFTDAELEPLLDGLRVITIAPELPGSLALIGRLRALGTVSSLGHSAATLEEARAGYAAGATSTTHLFNAMSGVDHRAPGLAVAALTDDAAYVELIADGQHVHPALWSLIRRAKPADRLMLVSDAISLAESGQSRGVLGGLEVEVRDDRCTLVVGGNLAGAVVALDTSVRNLVASGVDVPSAVAAGSRNPLALLGIADRGRIAVGQRADLVELDGELRVRRVMRAGTWVAS